MKNTYHASDALLAAYEVAKLLGQPLLLTGEPGTGKTEFADFVATLEGLDAPIVFDAQTISTANDLFYRFDTLGYFAYANDKTEGRPSKTATDFRTWTGLGEACHRANERGKRSVVLIDEIDKAPRDFPNDLLGAIDKMQRTVHETGEEITIEGGADVRPIVIITSNSEKNLPDAFLRRVVYYNIPFPDKITLLNILEQKETIAYRGAELDALVQHFLKIRGEEGGSSSMRKQPATAELICWVEYLGKKQFKTANLHDKEGTARKVLEASYCIIAKTRDDLTYLLENA